MPRPPKTKQGRRKIDRQVPGAEVCGEVCGRKVGGAATIGDGVQIAAPSPVSAIRRSGVSRRIAIDLYLSFARFIQLGWPNEGLAIVGGGSVTSRQQRG
jgi:hypothetical protein